jgi:hypothetical protein
MNPFLKRGKLGSVSSVLRSVIGFDLPPCLCARFNAKALRLSFQAKIKGDWAAVDRTGQRAWFLPDQPEGGSRCMGSTRGTTRSASTSSSERSHRTCRSIREYQMVDQITFKKGLMIWSIPPGEAEHSDRKRSFRRHLTRSQESGTYEEVRRRVLRSQESDTGFLTNPRKTEAVQASRFLMTLCVGIGWKE